MYKNINTLIARALLLGLFSSVVVITTSHAASMSDNFKPSIYVPPTTPRIPTPAPAPAPAPQVAEAPPPANNEFVLQKAARN